MNGIILVSTFWFIFCFGQIHGLRCYFGYGNSVKDQTECPKTANNYCATVTTVLNGTSTFAKSCVSSCHESSAGDLTYGISTTCCNEDLCNGQIVENPVVEKSAWSNINPLRCYTCSNCGQENIGDPLSCPSSQYYCSSLTVVNNNIVTTTKGCTLSCQNLNQGNWKNGNLRYCCNTDLCNASSSLYLINNLISKIFISLLICFLSYSFYI